MKSSIKSTLIIIGLTSFMGTAVAADSVAYTYDDWQVICQQIKKGRQCTMLQRGLDQKSGRQIYQVAISLPQAKGKPELDILAPLGVSLRAGVAVNVKKNADSPFKMPYKYCIGAGCLAKAKMNQKMMDAFRHGHQASIRIEDQNGKKIVLPISLKGYSRAFNKLMPKHKK